MFHRVYLRCFRLAIPILLIGGALLSPITVPAADNKGVEDLGKLVNKKPTYLLSNLRNFGRFKSLLTEMKLKDGFNELAFDTVIDPKTFEKATILIVVDRESGGLPSSLDYLKPASIKGSQTRPDVGDSMVLATEARAGGYWTVYVSAPNRDSVISFFEKNIRTTSDSEFVVMSRRGIAKVVRATKRPSAPEILFPMTTIRTTRPPIFFLGPRNEDKIVFYIEVTPSTGSNRIYTREDFAPGGNIFQTDDGGWAAFGQSSRIASQYELDLWKIKKPKGLEKTNRSIYIYEPEYDLKAGSSYIVRVRGAYPDASDSNPGSWSSDEEPTVVAVSPQPSDLGTATSLTRNDEVTDYSDPIFSSDGKSLLYRTNRSSKIGTIAWEIFADNPQAPGTGSNKITGSNRSSSDFTPTWGPITGDGIGYVTFSRQELGVRDTVAQNLWYVAVPTTEKPDVPFGMTQLTNSSTSERSFQPSWSPDGKKLAYAKDNARGEIEIWLLELGKNPRVLVTGITPGWGPDNRTLYYSSQDAGTYDVWAIDTLSGSKRAITSDAGNEFSPAVNPNGNGDLAYVSSASGNLDIWVLRGRNAVQLTQWLGNDISPTWTPDGKGLVFATTRFSSRQRYGLASIDPYGIK